MKNIRIFGMAVAMLLLFSFRFQGSDNQAAEKLGWKLAAQAYTFKNFTFFEAVAKMKSAGIAYVEAYRNQPIGAGIEGTMHYTMDVSTREKVLNQLKKTGIQLVNYGVVTGKDEADWLQIFEFAEAMGIQTITSEPAFEHLDLVERLAEKHGVNVAIHNHPKPSKYWNPEIVLEKLKGRGPRMGACADVGHWIRSGLNPVESLQKLEGRIISLHFKDLNKMDREAHDVPWGTGISNVPAMLIELQRQNFEGVFSIEYEYNWDNSLPEVTKCVEYFNYATGELASRK